MIRSKLSVTWLVMVCASLLWAVLAAATPGGKQTTESDLQPLLPIDRFSSGVSDADDTAMAASSKGASESLIFTSSFETVFIEPPLQGQLRMTRRAYLTPAADGTQIETLSENLQQNAGFRFLQADTGLLARISPDPELFRNRIDFERLNYTPGGLVEAPLSAVDLSLNNPAASTSGCEASDFNGFPAGHIALIQRGTCSFALKANNAESAGAVGVIIFNQGTAGRIDLYTGNLLADFRGTIPVLSTSFTLGQQWASTNGAVFRMRVDSGQRNNAWELVPVARPNAAEQVYWIRNSVTGEQLATRNALPINGISVNSVILDNAATDDNRAWWRVQGSFLINMRVNQRLAAPVISGSVTLLTSSDIGISSLCPNNDQCGSWLLDSRFLRPPNGTTRLRSSLGEFYLHQDGTTPKADRIRPAWASAQWILEAVPNSPYRRIVNAQTGDRLHVETGSLAVGPAEDGWWSAMWVLEPADFIYQANVPGSFDTTPLPILQDASGYIHLRNRWTNEYLAVNEGLALTGSYFGGDLRLMWVLDDQPVSIPDASLRTGVNELLGNPPEADILSSEAAGIYQLWRNDANIQSISGLEHLTRLRDLRLDGNFIQDVAPLANLAELNYVDLSRNPIRSIAPLEGNMNVADGDRVILLRTEFMETPPNDGAPLLARRATVLPSPGLMVMHHVATNKVIDAGIGSVGQLRDANEVSNDANWSIFFNWAQQRFHIRRNSYHDASAGYLTWNDEFNRLELAGSNIAPEWDFELVSSGQYRIKNTRAGGPNGYLQICNVDRLHVAQDNVACEVAVWYISPIFIQLEKTRAQLGYYNPQFGPPDDDEYTRIQNTRSREFLRIAAGSLGIGEVEASDTSAHWKVVPVEFDRDYHYVVQNRLHPTQYLYRHQDGSVRAGALPGGAPVGSTWANEPANQPFLFAFDADAEGFIRPLLARQTYLRTNNSQLSFAPGPGRDTVWRLDKPVSIPGRYIEFQRGTTPYVSEFSLTWKEPTGPSRTLQTRFASGSGRHDLPGDAVDIRATAVCVACGFPLLEDTVIFDITYARAPNRCLQLTGLSVNPNHKACETSEGSMVTFARDAAEEGLCEINALARYLPPIFEQLDLKSVAGDMLEGDVERAQQKLFGLADLRGPDISACTPFQSMSVAAGGSAGAIVFNAGGSLGTVWGVTPESSGAESFSSTGYAVGGAPRLLSIEASISFGIWKVPPKKFWGQALGISLQNNLPKEFKPDKLKKFGFSAGITQWFECNVGNAPVFFSSPDCDLHEDAAYLGFTIDLSVGRDISLPLPSTISLVYSKTCVPANFSGNDC